MDNEDNLDPFRVTHQLYNCVNSLLSNLFEEAPHPDRDIFQSHPVAAKKEEAMYEQEVQENQRFDLKTIEVVELLRRNKNLTGHFPKKLFPNFMKMLWRQLSALENTQLTLSFSKRGAHPQTKRLIQIKTEMTRQPAIDKKKQGECGIERYLTTVGKQQLIKEKERMAVLQRKNKIKVNSHLKCNQSQKYKQVLSSKSYRSKSKHTTTDKIYLFQLSPS